MSKIQKNVVIVLKRMATAAEQDEGEAEMLAEGLENMLDDIHVDDGFGTEGQNDPRGDARNGRWSILKSVEQQ